MKVEQFPQSHQALMRACRIAAKLSLKDVGAAIERHLSFVNKMELGHVDTLLDQTQMDAFTKLCLDNGAPETLVQAYIRAWELQSRAGNRPVYAHSEVFELLAKTLEELDKSGISKAFKNELILEFSLWRSMLKADEGFNGRRLGFKEVQAQYQDVHASALARRGMNLNSQLHYRIGKLERYQANNGEAKRDLEIAGDEAELSGDLPFQATVLIELGDLFRRSEQKNLSSARNYYQKAHGIYVRLNDSYGEAFSNLRVGSSYLIGGRPLEAKTFCDSSLLFAQSIGDPYLQRKALEYAAWDHSMLGELDEAVRLQKIADEIARASNAPPQDLAKSCNYLAGYCVTCALYDEAENLYRSADGYISKTIAKPKKRKDVNNEVDDDQELFIRSSILLGQGVVSMQRPSRWNEARSFLLKSREMADQIHEASAIGQAYKRLGQLDLLQNNYDRANINFEAARSSFQNVGVTPTANGDGFNPYYLSALELDYSDLYYHIKNYSESRKHAQTAREIAKNWGFLQIEAEAELWNIKLMICEGESDKSRLVESYTSIVKRIIPSGQYILQDGLRAIRSHLELMKSLNPELAIKIADHINRLWPSEFSAIERGESQSSELAKWYQFIRTFLIETRALRSAVNSEQELKKELKKQRSKNKK